MARLRRRAGARQAIPPGGLTLVCPIDSSHRFTATETDTTMVDNYKRHFEGIRSGISCIGAFDDSGSRVGPHQGIVKTKLLFPVVVDGMDVIEVDVRALFGFGFPVFVSHVAGNFDFSRTATGYAFFQLDLFGEGGGKDRKRNPDLHAFYNATPAFVGNQAYRCRIGKQGGNPSDCPGQPDNPPFAIEIQRQLETLSLHPFNTTKDTDRLMNWQMQVRGYR